MTRKSMNGGKEPRGNRPRHGRHGKLAGPVGDDHRHEWVVFSTALRDKCLMLQCVECGSMGTVDDPTAEEWGEAFHAPSRPYRWRDDSRVTRRGDGPLHVIRATGATRCECHARLGRPDMGDYERYPAEFTAPLESLTDEGRHELRELADLVSRSDLCSLLFPPFVHGFEECAGRQNSAAVAGAASRIELIDSKGLHCSPGVVAMVLRGFAAERAFR